ncbi:MAG: hypothetical protein CVU57_15675 [Deltaproteobacteria bacterium HGW-Deltaproteobacteria-15]|jgi:hypothetical protein|nr:MAG: hypothetical protein CVU57_15675 [Deltaproteobacteria bacterium HGW-Deltaproteobacteria-15]
MLSSISGNHAGTMSEVSLPNKRGDQDNGDGFPEGLSSASLRVVERFDVADFSAASGLLSDPLLLPTTRNVKELSADLSAKLAHLLSHAEMSAQPPIEFRVDGRTGSIRANSDFPEAQRIEELVNADPEVKRLFQTVNAISSHTWEIPKHLQFQREYLASDNPEQVVAKYSSLFGPQPGHDISMVFDGSAIRMLVDGRDWTQACFGR